MKAEPISPYAIALIESLVTTQRQEKPAPVKKTEPKVLMLDPNNTTSEKSDSTIQKSLLNLLNGAGEVERLAFETTPNSKNTWGGIYESKVRLVPDAYLKRIAIQDSLVATIVTVRAFQISAFGRPVPDRFSVGFKIAVDPKIVNRLNSEQRGKLEEQVRNAEKILLNCGHSAKWAEKDKLTFAQWLSMSTRNAVTVGRIATEIIWVTTLGGDRKFHGFRPIDAGTIYRAVPHTEGAQSVRENALHLLENLKNEKLQKERFEKNEYAWVQVIDGQPVQAFTEEECVTHNFYSVNDVELDGYPVTPIDTAISDITTHINITTHNRLYFQNGRASKGMVVIKSDDADERLIAAIKQHFVAGVNAVQNSFRMPVFAVGQEDEISWQPIDNSSRDMEFQYLSDTNSRVIMSAFAISPDEVPGYQHLSRGTSTQALSESNSEYKLEAARDVGIRPLLSQFEDFVNQRLFPLIDAELSQIATIRFLGLDAETPEKESIRLQQDASLHYVYDEILQKVEKAPIGMAFGGQFPLNPAFQQILDKYFTVGQIMEQFFGVKDASKDPKLAYRRDPFFFQFEQMLMEKDQMAMQQQQAAQQQQQPGDQSEQGQDDQQPKQEGDLATGIDQVLGMLGKSEENLPPSRRRLLARQRLTVEEVLKEMDRDMKAAQELILDVADGFLPKKEE
jgi:hypothetical protein